METNVEKPEAAERDLAASVIFTIYCHQHIESGRRYVGQTKKKMLQRWNQHVYTATRESKGWSHFANAIRKYGKDAFSHEILEICYDLEFSNAAEKKWIAHFDTTNPEKGYNFKSGGDHRPHPVRNPWNRPEFRERVTASVTVGLSDPVIQANRAAGNAKQRQTRAEPAFRAEASERTREVALRPEVMAKNVATLQKIIQDPEYQKTQSERWQDPAYRAQCSTGLSRGTKLLKDKTHCPAGHEYTEQNTAIRKGGTRACRACHNARTRARVPTGPKPTQCSRGHQLTSDLVFANAGIWRCKFCNRARVAKYHKSAVVVSA